MENRMNTRKLNSLFVVSPQGMSSRYDVTIAYSDRNIEKDYILTRATLNRLSDLSYSDSVKVCTQITTYGIVVIFNRK